MFTIFILLLICFTPTVVILSILKYGDALDDPVVKELWFLYFIPVLNAAMLIIAISLAIYDLITLVNRK